MKIKESCLYQEIKGCYTQCCGQKLIIHSAWIKEEKDTNRRAAHELLVLYFIEIV